MIKTERHGEIALIRLAHGKANALDLELCHALAERFDALKQDTARAVVLAGEGRMFSAGVNLVRLTAGGADYVRAFLPALHRLYEAVFHHPKPVVAAINGHAIAGGCVLACCADRRLAARRAGRIGVTEMLVGVPFPALAFEVMRFAASPRYFPELILSGATFATEDALARGLIDEIVEPEELITRALEAARGLAALPPATFAMTKRQIRQPVIDRMERHGTAVDAEAATVWTAPETLARVADYVEHTLKKG